MLSRRRADGGHRARRRHVGRRRRRDELFERALGVADTILGDKGITLISGSNTSPALTDPELHNPFYARTAHNDRIQGAIGAEFALGDDLGATTAATIADESPYTQGLVGAFEANFTEGGGTITGSEQVDSEATDFKPVLRSLAEQDPEVLYFPIFVAACTLIIRQAQDIMPDAELIVADGCLSSDTLKNAGPAADGVWASSPDLSAFQTNEFYSEEFIPAYQEASGPSRSRCSTRTPSMPRTSCSQLHRGGRDRQRRRVALDPSPGTA